MQSTFNNHQIFVVIKTNTKVEKRKHRAFQIITGKSSFKAGHPTSIFGKYLFGRQLEI